MNERVFISGGSGVIGHPLVDLLLRAGFQIFVGDLKPRPSHWPEEIVYWQGDLNDIQSKTIIDFAPKYFFHLAATFERTEEDYPFFKENFHHNIQLSHYLLDCIKDISSLKKVIFASSYLVYDPSQYLFDSPRKKGVSLSEDDALAPRNLCGMAKLLHEEELAFMQRFKKKDFSVVSARIFRSYGRNSRDIISRWIRSLLNDEPLTVYAKQGLFDFIFADDVAEGLLRLAESSVSGAINLGSGRARSVKELLQVLKLHFPKMKTEQQDSDILYEASQANMDYFQHCLNWKPVHELEDAIPKIIDYEKKKNEIH